MLEGGPAVQGGRSRIASRPRLLFPGLMLQLLLLLAPLPSAATATQQGVPRVKLSHKGMEATYERWVDGRL